MFQQCRAAVTISRPLGSESVVRALSKDRCCSTEIVVYCVQKTGELFASGKKLTAFLHVMSTKSSDLFAESRVHLPYYSIILFLWCGPIGCSLGCLCLNTALQQWLTLFFE